MTTCNSCGKEFSIRCPEYYEFWYDEDCCCFDCWNNSTGILMWKEFINNFMESLNPNQRKCFEQIVMFLEQYNDFVEMPDWLKFNEKNDETKAEPYYLTAVTYMEDWEQAKDCEAMLKANDIPASLLEQNPPMERNQNIAVMVPRDFLEEARVVIESENVEDDFYDLLFYDEEEDDFDRDFDEDDF